MKTILLTSLILCFFTGVKAQFDQSYSGQTHTTPSQTPNVQLYGGFVTSDAVNYPASHGSLFGYTKSDNGYGYSYQIFKGHTAPQLNVRFANSNVWAGWKKIFDSGNDMIYEGSTVESRISGYAHIYGRASDGILHLRGGTASGPVFINYYESGNVILAKGGGFVGIGTATPSDMLTLEKNSSYASIRLQRTGTNPGDFKIMSGYGQLEMRNSADQIKLVLEDNGNVGIGTDAPDAKLTVKGAIHTNEVRVDLNSPIDGPDYVFEKDYDLPSLANLETYINQNKHLPEVPSANEMYENGLNLKNMNLLLLKKVEELTLYLIDMKKENENLKMRIENLEEK